MNINRQTSLAVRLLELRRHLLTCKECRGAIKAADPGAICAFTRTAILDVASKWDANIPGRLAAAKSREGLQFICPEPNAHGPAYAATAEPVTVISHQGALF